MAKKEAEETFFARPNFHRLLSQKKNSRPNFLPPKISAGLGSNIYFSSTCILFTPLAAHDYGKTGISQQERIKLAVVAAAGGSEVHSVGVPVALAVSHSIFVHCLEIS